MYEMNDSTEHIMPCGHSSRFLVVDPIMGCGTGLANHYCSECEWKAWAWDTIKEHNAAANALEDKLERIKELESELAKANETIKRWKRGK